MNVFVPSLNPFVHLFVEGQKGSGQAIVLENLKSLFWAVFLYMWTMTMALDNFIQQIEKIEELESHNKSQKKLGREVKKQEQKNEGIYKIWLLCYQLLFINFVTSYHNYPINNTAMCRTYQVHFTLCEHQDSIYKKTFRCADYPRCGPEKLIT